MIVAIASCIKAQNATTANNLSDSKKNSYISLNHLL